MRALAVVAAVVLVSGSPSIADEITPKQSPSIVYYGDGINNQVSSAIFWEGQQGRLADEALKRKQSGDYRGAVSGYGEISAITGRARTNFVSGYTRSDGVSVRPYYRSRR